MYYSENERKIMHITPNIIIYGDKVLEKVRISDVAGIPTYWLESIKSASTGSCTRAYKIGKVRHHENDFWVEQVRETRFGDICKYNITNMNDLRGLREDIDDYIASDNLPIPASIIGNPEGYKAVKLIVNKEEDDERQLKMLLVFPYNYVEITWDIDNLLNTDFTKLETTREIMEKTNIKMESYYPEFLENRQIRASILYEELFPFIDQPTIRSAIEKYYEKTTEVRKTQIITNMK